MEDRNPSVLKKFREERGWSQRRLSVEADLTIGTIWGIEHGTRPSLDTALKLASIFGVPVEGLFGPDGYTGEIQENGSQPVSEAPRPAVASIPSERSGDLGPVGNR